MPMMGICGGFDHIVPECVGVSEKHNEALATPAQYLDKLEGNITDSQPACPAVGLWTYYRPN